MDIHGGACPYCGSVDGVEFRGSEFWDTTVKVFWYCEVCDKPITETYDLVFKNNSKTLDDKQK